MQVLISNIYKSYIYKKIGYKLVACEFYRIGEGKIREALYKLG